MNFISKNWFFIFLTLLVINLTQLLISIDKLELIPSTFLTAITAALAYLAYIYNREKIRLDLFEKRWDIYTRVIDYCSVVSTYASLRYDFTNQESQDNIRRGIQAAHESFRGIGFHKSKALFGDDVNNLFSRLSKSYAFLVSFDRNAERAREYTEELSFTFNIAKDLPDIMKPYLYFGNYKNN